MRKVLLSDVCDISSGGTPSRSNVEFYKGSIPWAKISDIENAKNGVLYSTEEHISTEGLKSIGGRIFPEGTLLFSMYGSIGKVALAGQDLSTNQAILGIRPKNGGELSLSYLKAWFESNKQSLLKRGRGVALKNLSATIVRNLEIELPPLDEQIRIAHLLAKVARLIAQRRENLKQLDHLLRSLFLEMFGDPKLNPQGFPVKRLSEFYINPKEGTKCGPFGSALKKEELVDSGVAVWTMDNITLDGQMALPFRAWITTDKYDDLEAYSVADGDIIISRAGTVGKMCVARMQGQRAVISTNLIRLRLGSDLRPLHFVSLMLYCKGRVGRLKTGADGAFTHMNTGVLDSLEFPYPPIELQDEFGTIASKVERIKYSYLQSLSDVEALYGALSQRAFKGELDLSRILLPDDVAQQTPADASLPIAEVVTRTEVGRELGRLPVPQARGELLADWLQQYLANTSPEAGLGSAQMLEGAGQALQAVRLEEDGAGLALSLGEYDMLKALIFKGLDASDLLQTFDDDGNRVALKRPPPGCGTW